VSDNIDDVVRAHEPFDRLTVLADEMLVDLPDDVKAIVMLTDDDKHGVAMAGWDDDTEALAHMFMHLQAIFKANGKTMSLMTEDGVMLG